MQNRFQTSDAAADPPSARQRMIALTEAAHLALHDHPIPVAIMTRGCGAASRRFLRAQLSLLTCLRCGPAGEDGLDGLIGALEADLGGPAPDTTPLIPFTTAGHCGARYVALGALMGRKSMRAALARSGTANYPTAYLTHPMPVPVWRRTLAALEQYQSDARRWAQAERGALFAFDHVRRELDCAMGVRRHIRAITEPHPANRAAVAG